MVQFITHCTGRYSYVESARLALEGGCRWIQLRMKNSTPDEIIPARIVSEQIKAVMEDIEPQAIKIGMVKDAEIVESFPQMEQAAKELAHRYQTCVLIKGGHLKGNTMCDVLAFPNGEIRHFSHRKIESNNLHGTGCTLSSAIATFISGSLAEGATSVTGDMLESAISKAKEYITAAIAEGSTRKIGKGNGPLWHLITK